MEEVDDPDIGPMIKWTDEEYEEITEQAELAREELLEQLSDTSKETLPEVEPTTNQHQMRSFLQPHLTD